MTVRLVPEYAICHVGGTWVFAPCFVDEKGVEKLIESETVEYRSSNTEIASVNNGGVALALSAGIVTVIVQVSDNDCVKGYATAQLEIVNDGAESRNPFVLNVAQTMAELYAHTTTAETKRNESNNIYGADK